jgi:hypothetical protein
MEEYVFLALTIVLGIILIVTKGMLDESIINKNEREFKEFQEKLHREIDEIKNAKSAKEEIIDDY